MRVRTTLTAGVVALNSVTVYSVAEASSSSISGSRVVLRDVFKEVFALRSGSGSAAIHKAIHITTAAIAAIKH